MIQKAWSGVGSIRGRNMAGTCDVLQKPACLCFAASRANYVGNWECEPCGISCSATGPCGPCSELYYDFKPELGPAGASLEDDSRFVEFYNLVFMESNRGPDGTVAPLKNKNIDTGMGLERVAQVTSIEHR